MYNYEALINEQILPQLEDSRFVKPYRDLVAPFTEETYNPGGPALMHQITTSTTSNARNYTKADVNAQAGSREDVVAKWNFTYQHTAAEVHNIDINQAANGGAKGVRVMLTDAIEKEMDGLWELIYDNVYAQIKADLLASGTYSDNALNRATYPTLVPYNEVTSTPITVALMRAMMYGTRLNKNTTPKSTYRIIAEPSVYELFRPQAALLHNWNTANVNNSGVDGGYAPLDTFEGSPIMEVQSMTTGDVFYTRKQDVIITKHRALSMEPEPTGTDSMKVNIRVGINARVVNVGKQGMMTNKG